MKSPTNFWKGALDSALFLKCLQTTWVVTYHHLPGTENTPSQLESFLYSIRPNTFFFPCQMKADMNSLHQNCLVFFFCLLALISGYYRSTFYLLFCYLPHISGMSVGKSRIKKIYWVWCARMRVGLESKEEFLSGLYYPAMY